MAADSVNVDLRQWPADALKAALTHAGVDAVGCAGAGALAARLSQVPLRDVRVALTSLGASAAGCVERGDLLLRLLETVRARAGAEEEEEPLPPGSVVRLTGLLSAPALNMQRATVVRYDPAAERYEVRLDWDGSTKRIREENLIVEEEASAPAGGPGTSPAEPLAEAAPPPEVVVVEEAPTEGAPSPPRSACSSPSAQAAPGCAGAAEPEGGGGAAAEPEGEAADGQAERPGAASVAPPAALPAEGGGGGESHALGAAEPSAAAAPPSPGAGPGPGSGGGPPEVRRRKRKFQDEVQPGASGVQEAAPAAAARPAEPEDAQPSAPAQAAREALASGSPWVVKAASKAAEEALMPLKKEQSEATPSKRPTKLRLGYRGGRPPQGPGSLASGLRSLFWAGEFCDVALHCAGATLRAHRAVLAGQSEVFRGLLREAAEVQLAEASPEAVRLMLDCLYEVGDESGYAPALPGINRDVLRLAERFQLPELTRRAAVFMAQGVTTENAVERLRLCEDFQLHDLRDRILEQVAANRKAVAEISKSPTIAGYPQLLQAILKRVAGPGGPAHGPSERSAKKGA